MNVEHLALQVTDPVGMAQWYVVNLGMRIVRQDGKPPYGHFLADGSGRVVLEIYNNPKVPVPDYWSTDPVIVHLAFATKDIPAVRSRLVEAGATNEGEIQRTDLGDEVLMLRDPWGLPVQLVNRSKPMS